MAWGKEWTPEIIHGWDLGKEDKTAYAKWEDGKLTPMSEEEFKNMHEGVWPDAKQIVEPLPFIEEWSAVDPKVWEDAKNFGTGFSQDGKHVPLDKIYNYSLTDPVPMDGDKLATKRPFNNLKPTHDPYTNPNAHIYYECGCGAILDPQTKSFAALNNYASEKGWKIRFGADSYVPYCVKCGEGVE